MGMIVGSRCYCRDECTRRFWARKDGKYSLVSALRRAKFMCKGS